MFMVLQGCRCITTSQCVLVCLEAHQFLTTSMHIYTPKLKFKVKILLTPYEMHKRILSLWHH